MRTSGFGWIHSMNSLLRLCLCLVLVGLIFCAAAERADAATVNGSPPVIKVFTGTPLTVQANQSVEYKFEVYGARKIQVIEAGNPIKDINNPTYATLRGTVNGLPAYAIQTGDSSTFNTVLVASNGSLEVKKEITLSFATVLPPKPAPPPAGQPGATENKANKSRWLAQTSLPPPLTQSTTPATTHQKPEFFKCPSGCEYCLEPGEAAGRGFTQKCSEERCYYSPNNQQNWYCYSKPATVWCCSRDGKVYEATKDQCAQVGGAYYATQAEATKACQQLTIGWCCSRDGKVYQATQAQCAQIGAAWYATQAEATKACQQLTIGWCCSRDGKVYQATQAQCAQMGAAWYATQAEATRACQPATCWCCAGGKVVQTTQTQCAQMGGACYSTQAEATRACQPAPTTCWCCSGGKVYQTTSSQCSQAKGTCYPTQQQAAGNCAPPLPPPTLPKPPTLK